MSTDKKNAENGDMEVEETSNDETSDTKPATNNDASEESVKSKDKDSKKKLKGKEVKKDAKAGNVKSAKEGKAGKAKDEDSKSEEEDDEDDDDDEDEDEKSGDGKVPLLDQPLELSGTRERKKVTRFSEEYKTEPKDTAPLEIPEGSGTPLGNIPRIESNIQRSKPDSLKPLHKLLFSRVGKASSLKKNLRKFNGFDFEKDSEQYMKKKQSLLKFDTKTLKELSSIMDLKVTLKRDELVENLLNFLLKPEDSGKGANVKPRPKRAARANNKTYSESDEEEERKSSRRGKKKRANLKEVSSDDEDDEKDKADKKDPEEDDEDNASDDGKKEKNDKENDSVEDTKENDSENEDDAKDEESSDDSEETSSKSKKGARAGKNNKKQAAKKPKPAAKKAEKKPASKKKAKSDEESSADEPSTKKLKAPPTDEEIKSYVKQILEGANLEETTMKIVCKQVYAHYPEFDLAHKKDFIKTTVKSLIST